MKAYVETLVLIVLIALFGFLNSTIAQVLAVAVLFAMLVFTFEYHFKLGTLSRNFIEEKLYGSPTRQAMAQSRATGDGDIEPEVGAAQGRDQ